MRTTDKNDNDQKDTTTSTASTIGPWHFVIALIGICPIVFLAGFTFRSLFTTAGDVLALISYIAAVIAAVFGVQIAVRGAEASAENRVNKNSSRNAVADLEGLKSDLDNLAGILRTIGDSPPGQKSFFIEPGQPLNLHQRVEIPADKLENIQVRVESIGRTLRQIAR